MSYSTEDFACSYGSYVLSYLEIKDPGNTITMGAWLHTHLIKEYVLLKSGHDREDAIHIPHFVY